MMAEVCGELGGMASQWNMTHASISNIMYEIDIFGAQPCSCPLPKVNLNSYVANDNPYMIKTLKGNQQEDDCKWQCSCHASHDDCDSQDKCGRYSWNKATKECKLFESLASLQTAPANSFFQFNRHLNLWAPNLEAPFIGNFSVCSHDVIQERFMKQPQEGKVDWVGILLRSGMFANVFAQLSVANFISSLLALVDPLSLFGGVYEAPVPEFYAAPVAISSGKEHLIIRLLRVSAFRSCMIWGLLSLTVILNVVISFLMDFRQGKVELGTADAWGIVFMLLPLVFTPLFMAAACRINRTGVDEEEGEEEEEDSHRP